MSGVMDGAGVSLRRQMDLLRFIYSKGKRGVSLGEAQLYIRARHGLSKDWVIKYLKEWRSFGVVTVNGGKFRVTEEAWQSVQELREGQEFEV